MYDMMIARNRPVQSVHAAEPRKETASASTAAETAPGRDTASVSGRGQSARALGAEQALARLLEMGVLESASRPVSPGGDPVPAAELTIQLDGDEAAAAAKNPEAEAGAEQSPAAEEWRPYQPPSAPAVMDALRQSVSADGRSITMLLYGAADGSPDGLLLELGGISIPLNADGTLLAGFLDGTFRLLTLDQEMLMQLLTMGMASMALSMLPEGAPGADPLPEPFSGQPLPAEQDAPQAQAARQPSPEASERTQFAPPATIEAPPSPVSQQALTEARAALSPEFHQAQAHASNGGENRPAPLPQMKPGGALEWASMRASEQSFRTAAENVLRREGDPWGPEALRALHQLRQEFNQAAAAQRGDGGGESAVRSETLPAAGQTPGTETARAAVPGENAAARTNPDGQAVSVSAAPADADAVQENALRFLRSVLSAAQPSDPETAALLKSAFLSDDASLLLRKDDTGALTRRLSDYLAQLLGGQLSASTRQQAELLDLPREPQRREDELEKAWKRRQIAFEVDSAWTGNLKQWLLHVDGWRIPRCQDYINDRTDEWTTGLMKDQPARFRQWLSSPLRYAASTGWYNGATGSFPIETLPRGFTDEDFRRWVQWDVLDYL